MKPQKDLPEELGISTNLDHSLAIMREINRIIFWEKLRTVMPMIHQCLVDAGVDFSKAKIPTEAEVERSIKDAMREGYLV